MSKKHYIFIIFAFIFLCGCSDDTVNKTNLADAIELSAIKAEIVSSTNSTRATASPYLEDNISRYVFEHNDKMVFTKIQRTDHALTDFKYRDVAFYCNELELFRFVDDGQTYGPLLGGGKIRFRQLAPLIGEYADLKVYAL